MNTLDGHLTAPAHYKASTNFESCKPNGSSSCKFSK